MKSINARYRVLVVARLVYKLRVNGPKRERGHGSIAPSVLWRDNDVALSAASGDSRVSWQSRITCAQKVKTRMNLKMNTFFSVKHRLPCVDSSNARTLAIAIKR